MMHSCLWKLQPLVIVIFLFFPLPHLSGSNLRAAELIHQYDFNGNLDDTLGNGDPLQIFANTASYGYGTSEFWWTASSSPGGGLILDTNLSDPKSYSLGFRIKYNEVGPGWKKIISFRGESNDNGLYFLNGHLQFYPYASNRDVTFSPDVFYDFILSRSADDVIRLYVVEQNGLVTKVYEENDPSGNSIPIYLSDKYRFMFFMDDTITNSEWTSGGSVKIIRVWDGTLTEEDIPDALSDVFTKDATNISYTSANLNGVVNPKNQLTTVSFEYGTTDEYGNEAIADQSPVSGSTNQNVSAEILDLAPGTTYHFRVKATNSAGTSYGADRTFTTLIALPTVTTAAVSNITQTTATTGGNITSNGGDTVTAYGVCWSTSPNPTIADSHTTEGSTNTPSTFISNITGLTPGTTYHVRAYATNAAGTSYGSDISFKTQAPFSVPTLNEWGMIIFSLLVAGFTVLFIRKKNQKSC